MSNKLKELRAKEGFTIIEVIIVLVIGAVIMLAVFLVVPQLQRTQRNSRRQADVRRVYTAAEQVNANTGSFPANDGTGKTAITNITGLIYSSGTTEYAWAYAVPTSTTGTNYGVDTIIYNNGTGTTGTGTCGSNNTPATSGTASGKVVVATGLETGTSGTNTAWCVGN
ncbi:hypothetical protein LBMAG34_2800 [Candidatus Saccharibacteria bacterium]|nr:hypothetical protein LBMAG34_2800 [Candidatus Saccharibacteria bacterium]